MSENSYSKKKLREFFLEVRQELSQKTVEQKSTEILHRVIESKEFSEAKTVHTYVSITKNNEVQTLSLIKNCFENGKKVVVPRIAGDGVMDHIELSSLDHLEVNHWGVPEPVDGRLFPVTDLDLIVVPMVAGDYFKNRLGYGKGYYDRFLKECAAPKTGLLFDCQLYEKKIPVESFDIPLDILITESKRIE